MRDPLSTHLESSLDAQFAEVELLVVTDPAKALEIATAALPNVDRIGSVQERLRARRMLAMAYANTNQFDQALLACEQAELLPGAADAPIEFARIQLAAMQPLAVLGHVDDAIKAGKDALEPLEASGHGNLAGRAALNIGSIFAMTGRPGQALPWFDQARRLLGDEQLLLGQTETNRGTALAALDRFEEAEQAFERASSLLSADEMSWAAAIAEGNLADLTARQGAFNRSLRYFETSRRHLEQDEAWGDLGRLNAEEATVLATMGLTTIARDAFVGAIAMLQKHGSPADFATAQLSYATTLIDAGEFDAASALLTKTDELLDIEQHTDINQRLHALRARLALAVGKFDDASRLIEMGLVTVAGLPVQRLRWSLLQAECSRRKGNPPTARAILVQALTVAERAQVTPLTGELHQALAELARDAGQPDEANDHARRAIDTFEAIRGTIQADRLRQSWHHSRLRVYSDLYRSLVGMQDQGAQGEAFDVAERIRSRMLMDALQSLSHDVDMEESGTEAERSLADELADHRRWLNWMYSSLADGNEPDEAQLAELRNRERAANRLADRLATLRPRSNISTPLSLDRIQIHLGDTSAILSYLVVDDCLTVQVITSDSIHGVAELATTGQISDLVAQMQFQTGRALVHGAASASPSRQARLHRDMDAVLGQLYQVLVAPIEQWLTGIDHVTVVPSGNLHSVPFAALKHDRYLSDRFVLATTPSVSILATMQHTETNGDFESAHQLVVGVPDEFAPGLGQEARAVAARFSTATLLLGEEATCDAALTGMPHAGLIHLACHARFDVNHPTASGLRLADGWLTLDRLAEAHLDSPLVLLTGCETGRVRVEEGDDLVGMMAAMVGAGASGLITSLWKTHDAAATALVGEFYDALEGGGDPVTALQASQQEVRRQYPHPALWAPFVAVIASRKGLN